MPSLYNAEPGTPYYYWKGCNLRMYAAWAIGVAFVIHGLAGSYDTGTSQASVDMYRLGFILSCTTGSLSYLLFCYIWPVETYPAAQENCPRSFEYMATTDGYFEDTDMVIEGRSDSDEHVDAKRPHEKTANVAASEV